jgi:hypothetical protein
MGNKLTHLQMLQPVITRMASNSFFLKGWSVTLVSALFALAADKANFFFVYLAYFPVVMFWALDGYFLRQERLFRKLYDRVRALPENDINFSMDTTVVATEVDGWFRTCFSVTLRIFHGTVFGVVVLVMFVLASRSH